MIVRSFGALQSIRDKSTSWYASDGSIHLYGSQQSYDEIYQAQPNVRTCVDFPALNVAHLGLHVYRRISDTDRERLRDHGLAKLIERPNEWTTRFRLFEGLMQDLGIHANAYWLKVRGDRLALLRLPPDEMMVEGRLYPTSFIWTQADGRRLEFAPSEIVYFRWSAGHHRDSKVMGLSRLETLQRTLAEEDAAGQHREAFWRNSARIDGIVSRPKEKPRYNEIQVKQWREQWQAAHAGAGNGGKTVLLQDGETFTPSSWSAKDSEYMAARKQAREECAAANHIPQPFVGILDHATFSNIREQHKHLYQDTLGPSLEMIQEDIELQLLPEFDDTRDVYVEFNIAEKLKGSFEEQASAIQALVGRPVMTANEGRGRLNLPSIKDDPSADQLAAQQGGPSDASTKPQQTASGDDTTSDNNPTAVDVMPVITATRQRQTARLEKLPVSDRPAAFTADLDRWNRELAADLSELTGRDETAHAAAINVETLRQLEAADESSVRT